MVAMIPAPIRAVADPARRAEAERLDALFREVTGWSPRSWQGGRIIGYGQYGYRYASGRTGTFLATGFAVLARKFSLHIMPGYTDFPDIGARLGPHSRGKSCWYIPSLTGVDRGALADLIGAGLADLRRQWPVTAT